jgi:hypothetical protein
MQVRRQAVTVDAAHLRGARPVNLLNVAVSRARRRLFVIGDLTEYCDAPNFRELARALPRHPWHTAGDRPR